jgi:hypothetical protein
MIFTSIFKIAGHLLQSVAISRGVPRGWLGRRYLHLAPPRNLIRMTEPERFIKLYRAEILDRLDPSKVIQDLGGDDLVMVCWEPPGEFCHRQVVAAWLKKELGLEVLEFNPKLRSHQEWVRKMRERKA